MVEEIKKKFEFDLEGLRGFAALLVLWCHAIGIPKYLDPGYNPSGALGYQPPAHICVLIFFVLSGYVIALTTKKPLGPDTAGVYMKKRLLRIYPIYFVSILAAILVATQWYSLRTVLGNFTFLQGLVTPIIDENIASWSLQYEMLYYLLFIPLSFSRINPLVALSASFVLACASMIFLPDNALLSSYSFGFVFWCCGWVLIRYVANADRVQASASQLLGIMLLIFTLRSFDYLGELLQKVSRLLVGHTADYPAGLQQFDTMIGPSDLAFAPYAIVAVLLFTHKKFPWRKSLTAILFLLPAFSMLYYVRNWKSNYAADLLLPTVSYLVALVCFYIQPGIMERVGKKVMKWLIKAGSISYGIYIIQFPVLILFRNIQAFSGTEFTYWVRFVLFIPLVILISYFLEKKFQPFARNLLDSSRREPVTK